MTTRMQHHVWRYYLESWSCSKNQVYCLRNEDLFLTNPRNIMVERDFYKLIPFTKEDIEFFEYWLKEKCEPRMRALNQSTFDDFMKIANGNEIVQNMKNATDEEKGYFLSSVIESEEKLHQGIENSAIPLIKELRQERLGFLNDQKLAISFFYFIANQYFRTKRMREQIGEVLSTLSPAYDFGRLRHVLCNCYANNFGGSLFDDRGRLEIVFLKDRSNRLITGDQPIVNLVHKEIMEHDDVALYYPLCPNLAILVSFKKLHGRSMEVPNEVAEQLNEAIVFNANQFLVGASKTLLKKFIKKPVKQPDVLSLLV